MPLGLSFNQYGFYPYVSFWSPSLSRGSAISQLVGLMACYVPIRISSLGKPLTIGVKQRADRLLLRIYFAPYGRTNNVVMYVLTVYMRSEYIGIFTLQKPVGQFLADLVGFLSGYLPGGKGLDEMITE